jgi:hypothetical protein
MSKVTPPLRTGFSPAQNTNTGALKLFPISVSLTERFSLQRGISRGCRPEAVGGRSPASQETRGAYCEGDLGSAV